MEGAKFLPKRISLIFLDGDLLILPPRIRTIHIENGEVRIGQHIYTQVKEVICR